MLLCVSVRSWGRKMTFFRFSFLPRLFRPRHPHVTVEEKDLVIKNSWVQLDLCRKRTRMSGHDFRAHSQQNLILQRSNKRCSDSIREQKRRTKARLIASGDLSPQTYLQLHNIVLCLNLSSFHGCCCCTKGTRQQSWLPLKARASEEQRGESCKLFFYSFASLFIPRLFPSRVVSYAVWWTLYFCCFRFYMFLLWLLFVVKHIKT